MHTPKHTTLATLLALALALSGLFALPTRSYAAVTIVYVNSGASGTGAGSSWADAYPSLADALAGAGYGAAPWKEAVVQGLQASLALAMLAGAVLVVYALR